MRPHGSPKALERRRRKAVSLLAKGLSLSEVAQKTGASVSSVFRWQQAHLEGGESALTPKPVPGRPAKLDSRQQGRLWKILLKGAIAYGFPNDLWTLKRIARVIKREFGVRLHPSHVWKILRRGLEALRSPCQCPGPGRMALSWQGLRRASRPRRFSAA